MYICQVYTIREETASLKSQKLLFLENRKENHAAKFLMLAVLLVLFFVQIICGETIDKMINKWCQKEARCEHFQILLRPFFP